MLSELRQWIQQVWQQRLGQQSVSEAPESISEATFVQRTAVDVNEESAKAWFDQGMKAQSWQDNFVNMIL